MINENDSILKWLSTELTCMSIVLVISSHLPHMINDLVNRTGRDMGITTET